MINEKTQGWELNPRSQAYETGRGSQHLPWNMINDKYRWSRWRESHPLSNVPKTPISTISTLSQLEHCIFDAVK